MTIAISHLPLAMIVACTAAPPAKPQALNVLLITIDTFRADRLGTGVAPAIDRLAASGISFTSARTAVPLTLPSHVTIHTGLLPPAHGVRENGIDTLASTHQTMATLMKGAGYETAAFVGAFVLDHRFGLAQGFDTYDDQIPRDPNASDRLEAERPASIVIDHALAWLERRSPGRPVPSPQSPVPFFLWIHLYDPHAPYNPPAEFLAGGRTPYDGEIAYADSQVARLLDALRARGLIDRTLVAVAGDHGEGLGDHGERTHGMLVYDSTLRVPLVIAAPVRPAARRDEPVSLADLAPTILRAAGIAPPEVMRGRDLLETVRLKADTTETRKADTTGTRKPDGAGTRKPDTTGTRTADGAETRKPDTTGTRTADGAETRKPDRAETTRRDSGSVRLQPDLDLYSETEYPRVAGWSPLQALTDGRWMTIRAGSSTELYDLRRDPREEHDLSASQATVAAAMAARAEMIHASAAASGTRAISPEAQERLRSLGYVASSVQTTPAPDAPNPVKLIAAWNEFEGALSALAAGRQDAQATLQRLAAASPDAPVMQTTYALALKDAGKREAALAVYRQAAKRWPTDAVLLHDLAVAARDAALTTKGVGATKLNDEAMRADQAALTLAPDSAPALNGLGLLAIDNGRPGEAVPSFERAAALDSNNASYWTNLGNARRATGGRDGAEQAYRRALEVDARTADAANGLGVLLVEAGRPADAVPWFERAIAAAPDLVEARLNLGIALQQSGQTARASETYRQVLAAPTRFKRERDAAAKLLAALGDGR